MRVIWRARVRSARDAHAPILHAIINATRSRCCCYKAFYAIAVYVTPCHVMMSKKARFDYATPRYAHCCYGARVAAAGSMIAMAARARSQEADGRWHDTAPRHILHT